MRAPFDRLSTLLTRHPADTLIDGGQQPAVASFLGGAELAVDMAGLDPQDLDDQQVRDLQAEAFEQLPPEVAALFEGLIGDGEPPTGG